MLTELNWSYCHYHLGDWRALIHIGGEWSSATEAVEEIFYLNILDPEHRSISQQCHPSLSLALEAANQHCKFWSFVDQMKLAKQQASEKDAGCSNCQAH